MKLRARMRSAMLDLPTHLCVVCKVRVRRTEWLQRVSTLLDMTWKSPVVPPDSTLMRKLQRKTLPSIISPPSKLVLATEKSVASCVRIIQSTEYLLVPMHTSWTLSSASIGAGQTTTNTSSAIAMLVKIDLLLLSTVRTDIS